MCGWPEPRTPADNLARELADRRKKAAVGRGEGRPGKAFGRNCAGPDAQRTMQRLNGLLAFHGELGVAGRATTAKAMDWVKGRGNARRRYFTPGGEPIQVPGGGRRPGLRFWGPRGTPAMLRESDPRRRASELYELAWG